MSDAQASQPPDRRGQTIAAEIRAAVQQLNQTEQGRATMRRTLFILDNGTLDVEAVDRENFLTLIRHLVGPYRVDVRATITSAIGEPFIA